MNSVATDVLTKRQSASVLANPLRHASQSVQIYRFDDFLSVETAAALGHAVTNLPWQYGWKSNTNMPGNHWHVDFDGRPRADNDESVAEKIVGTPAQEVWAQAVAGPLRGHTLIRAYANAHTHGVPGNPHMDRKEEGYWTLVYYPNAEWRPAWGGETVFFDHAGDIAFACLPRTNRAVVFPSNLSHAARGVDRQCYQMRAVVVLKTRAPV